MRTHSFDYITGTMRVPVAAPESWSIDGLDAFYKDPNHPEWGGTICRILYHESIHFWQFFSSGYLANLLAEDWIRVKKFDEEKVITPTKGHIEKHFTKADSYPFSAAELTECWARYWDVHTRSPLQIIQEDEVLSRDPQVQKALSTIDPRYPTRYTGVMFDTFMSEGKDSKSYAQPYRWMLEVSTTGSRFVNSLFPALVTTAFGSPDPVRVFCETFYLIEHSPQLKNGLMAHMNSNIHFNWFYNWGNIIHVVNQLMHEAKMPLFTSGVDVIERGPLKTHPIYQLYAKRIKKLFAGLLLFSFGAESPGAITIKEEDSTKFVDFMERDVYSKHTWIAFGLPGQPNYRAYLGHYLPPPCIHFSNMTYYAYETPQLYETDDKKEEFKTVEAFKQLIDGLNEQVRKYKNAKKAMELGLPVDTFN
ncbi:hypothetical protein OCK74_12425 [Chitinophagaceae bacterium LB-8]|uniref:Uncharacterized protein n=1 Tax=Paraflavisolibacter caeni TaxID=2982496 RepID=A0A9X2XP51_9BACT|nr:hypothetical protein [Paraflavisolibacter caeni]MCU7549929.1 hypothetical protein [Paraflavisolibacter caeni]